MKNYDQLIDLALVELESCETLNSLEKARLKYFGKNGEVTSILKNLSIFLKKIRKKSEKSLIYSSKIF